jgi:hypothetical protein
VLVFADDGSGFATFNGGGQLTLMGKVAVRAEFVFAEGDEADTLEGIGIASFVAANGEVLVSNVLWNIDADGNGDLRRTDVPLPRVIASAASDFRTTNPAGARSCF